MQLGLFHIPGRGLPTTAILRPIFTPHILKYILHLEAYCATPLLPHF